MGEGEREVVAVDDGHIRAVAGVGGYGVVCFANVRS